MGLRLLIAQHDFLVGDVTGNRAKVAAVARRARDIHRADLVVFPELTLTGYPPEDLLLRPELVRRVEQAIDALCAEVEGVTLVLGYPRRRAEGLFNAAGVIRDGRVLAEYHKQFLPNYSVFDEKRYFVPGREPCVFDQGGLRIGLNICEDIWESAPARQAAEAGARFLININASPYHYGKAPEREVLVQKRARDNQLPILYANLIGGQDELVFDGGSFVVDRDGNLVRRCAYFIEEETVVEIDDEGRPLPLQGGITPALSDEEGIYRAVVLGIRDYVRKNGFQGAVLGLSGGIDSALTLALAVDALGPDQVEVVLMPSRYTAAMSIEDAQAEAEALGVEYRIIPIEPAFQTFLQMLAEEFAGKPVDVTEENIQARCRGIVLMAISNKKGRILLTTGNKSEVAVGYATLYGDMAGGYAPIKDLFKTTVYRLARYRNTLGEVIPARVLERPPSAELAPDQVDQDSLPPYEVLDPVLRRYIEDDQSIDEIVAAGFAEEVVRRVTRMVDRNEYKRRQAPPGVRITRRAFGRDRRYPITSGF